MKKIIFFIAGLSVAATVFAQPMFVPMLRMDNRNHTNFNLNSRYTEGSNKGYSMALSEWNVNASYSTVQHREKYSWQTRINVGHTTQYDARGNMFTTPGMFPVELFEMELGTRYREDINASFDMAGDINGEWRYGCDVAITSTVLNKTVRNRYLTYNVGGTFVPSFQWHRGSCAAGASLILATMTEQVNSSAEGPDQFSVFFGQRQWYGADLDWKTGKSPIMGQELTAVPFSKHTIGTRVNVMAKSFSGDIMYNHIFSQMGTSSVPLYFFPGDDVQIFGRYGHKMPSGLHGFASLHLMYKNIRSYTGEQVDPSRTMPDGEANQVTLNASWTVSRNKDWSASIAATYFIDMDDSQVIHPYVFNQTLQRVLASASFHKSFGAWRAGAKVFAEAGWLEDDVEGHKEYIEGASIYHNDLFYNGWKWYLTTPGHGFELNMAYHFRNGISLSGAFDIIMRKFFDGIDLRHRLNAKLGLSYDF